MGRILQTRRGSLPWKCTLAIAVVVALVAGCTLAACSASGASGTSEPRVSARMSAVPSQGNAYEHGELLVGVDNAGASDDATLQRVQDALQDAGFSIAEVLANSSERAGAILRVDVAPSGKTAAGETDAGTGTSATADAETLQAALERAARIESVAYVQPNYRYSSAAATEAQAVVSDPDAAKQWYLNSWDGDDQARGANVVAAWKKLAELGEKPASVDVAVLDTGIYSMPYTNLKDYSPGGLDYEMCHQEFDEENLALSDGRDMVNAFHYTGDPLVVNQYNPYGDNNGHGTHVSALIAARSSAAGENDLDTAGIAGIAQSARIIPIKVLDGSGEGNTADFVKAFDYLLGNAGQDGAFENLHVINMSFSTLVAAEGDSEDEGDEDAPDDPAMADVTIEEIGSDPADDYRDNALNGLIDAASAKNIVTVCAAGNESSTEGAFPADIDGCVSVTALDADGENAPYSNYNAKSDLSAPGTGIYSAWASQGDAYQALSGTSQASAIVSGVFALLWSADPALSVADAKAAVYGTAHIVEGERQHLTANADGAYSASHGAVDAAAALESVLAKKVGSPIRSLADDACTIEAIDAQEHTGSAVEPSVTVSYDGTELRQNVDYRVRYVNNSAKGRNTAAAIVEGAGDYVGWRAERFSILDPEDLEDPEDPKDPEDPEGPEDPANTDDGGESGSSAAAETTKDAINIAAAKVMVVGEEQTYTAKELEPAVVVTLGGKQLERNTDYRVSYSANKNPGTATVAIAGIGAYRGEKTAHFAIKLATTKIAKLSAGKKRLKASWKRVKQGGVGYQVRWSAKKSMKPATSQSVKKNSKTALSISKAKRSKAGAAKALKGKTRYYVQVRTYKKIGKKTYHSAWSAKKAVKTK